MYSPLLKENIEVLQLYWFNLRNLSIELIRLLKGKYETHNHFFFINRKYLVFHDMGWNVHIAYYRILFWQMNGNGIKIGWESLTFTSRMAFVLCPLNRNRNSSCLFKHNVNFMGGRRDLHNLWFFLYENVQRKHISLIESAPFHLCLHPYISFTCILGTRAIFHVPSTYRSTCGVKIDLLSIAEFTPVYRENRLLKLMISRV